ncbi:MAG: LptF/LptG family permease, partial [Candidatus Omnitrophica bacterium]|nr:LptF/LptG family permease [Candidatus Omnitrophota bacterium]
VVNKGVEVIQVVKIFLLFLPYVLIFTIPISVLAAVLLGFGRLSGDNEITALRTSGVSVLTLVVPVVICGFMISLASVPLNDRLLPEAEYNARKLVKTVGIKHPSAMLEPGVFIKGFKNYIVFIHAINGNKLEDVRIYEPQEGDKPTRSIVAARGEIISLPESDSVRLKLENGTADEITPEKPDEFYKLSFKEYFMTLDLDGGMDADSIQKKPREKSIRELSVDIDSMGKSGVNVTPLRVELHKKLALAFSNLVFILVGIPLAISTHRREKVIGFGMAMTLFLVYWGIMLSGIALSIQGIMPAWAGVWSANIILSCMGMTLFFRMMKR